MAKFDTPFGGGNSNSDGEEEAIVNGEREYVGSLSLDYNSDNLISNFSFDWKQIKEEDYDEEGNVLRAEMTSMAQRVYDSIIDADYETGITPYRIQYLVEDEEENNYFFSWEHGDILRPGFLSVVIFPTKSFDILYSNSELDALQKTFPESEDFETTVNNIVQNMAENIHNRMKINMNQNLDFQKNKSKKIGFKKISRFEIQQEDSTNGTTTTTTAISNSGVY